MTIPSDAAAGAPLDTAPAVPSGEQETDVLIILKLIIIRQSHLLPPYTAPERA